MVSFAVANQPIGASIADRKAHSVIGVPRLAPAGRASGIKPLLATEDKPIPEDDRDVPGDVAGRMATSLRNALVARYSARIRAARPRPEDRRAGSAQLLPHSLPKLPGYVFFAYYRAAHEVGGDYYDFVPLPDNRLGIALGDVSGKGVAAALIMAKFSGDARLNLRTEGSAAAAAHMLNTTLCETGIEERFITLSLLVLDASSGRLQLCSAGHPPVLLAGRMGQSKSWARMSGVSRSASYPAPLTSRSMSS